MSDIQSVKRAFAILKVIAVHPGGVGLAEIAEEAELPKSTVSRMLSTLENIEAVEREPTGEGFRIGPETVSLAWQPHHLVMIARPYLQELMESTNETASLCIPDGESAYYAEQINSQHNVQIRDWTGKYLPAMHIGSPGKLFMAHWSATRLKRFLRKPLERYTDTTITNIDELWQHLATVREQGYAWVHSEYEEGLDGVSAPIYNKRGNIIAAANIYGPAYRLVDEQKDKVTELTIDIARKITERLSGTT